MLISNQIEVITGIKSSLLHLEAVRVGVEDPFALEVSELPVDDNLLAQAIVDGKTVEEHVPLNSVRVRKDLDYGCKDLIITLILVVDGEALDASRLSCGLLDARVGRVDMTLLVVTERLEDVGATCIVVRAWEAIIACSGVVLLEGELHVSLSSEGLVGVSESHDVVLDFFELESELAVLYGVNKRWPLV